MTHNELRDWIGKAMDAKGFHSDMADESFADAMMLRATLVQTEMSEAVQEAKRHWGKAGADLVDVKGHVAEEAADSAIRLYDLSFMAELNLDGASARSEAGQVGKADRTEVINRLGHAAYHTARVFKVFLDLATDAVVQHQRPVFHDKGEPFKEEATGHAFTAVRHLGRLCEFIGKDLVTEIRIKMRTNMARPRCYGTPSEGQQ